MKIKIVKKVFVSESTVTLKNGSKKKKKNYTYKIFQRGIGMWISESLLDLGIVKKEDEFLILKEPILDNFDIEEKVNKNGKFYVLIAKTNTSSEVNEPVAVYETATVKKNANKRKETEPTQEKVVAQFLKQYKESNKTQEITEPKKKDNNVKSTNEARFSFMKTLLEKSSNRNTDTYTKKRILDLISNELKQKESDINGIINGINEIKQSINNLKETEKPVVSNIVKKNISIGKQYWIDYNNSSKYKVYTPNQKYAKVKIEFEKPFNINVCLEIAEKNSFLLLHLIVEPKQKYQVDAIHIKSEFEEYHNVFRNNKGTILKWMSLPQKTNDKRLKALFSKKNISSISIQEQYKWIESTIIEAKKTFKSKIKLSKEIKRENHKPQEILNWLKYFTLENSNIKYSTHIWDGNHYNSYKDFIESIDNDFTDYNFSKMQFYNKDLYWNKIYPFLFQKDLTSIQRGGITKYGWGKYKLKIGWQYPEILGKWCEINFDNKTGDSKMPMTMGISKELLPKERIKGKTIQYFEDIVDVFKDEIEFRNDDLYLEVKKIIRQELSSFNFEGLDKLKGKSFYTNTESISLVLRRIFKIIKKYSEHQEIKLDSFLKDDSIFIEILQVNSFSNKDINHPKIILKEKTGDFYYIVNKLKSLCDFSIESKFRWNNDKKITSTRIDYLYDGVDDNDWKPETKILKEEAQGFKYILKFLL